MNAIIKNENVYLIVREKSAREGVDIEPHIILEDENFQQIKSLYGGRVLLQRVFKRVLNGRKWVNCLVVDGIVVFTSIGLGDLINCDCSLEQIAAYLNQIENLGVDSFLENYKMRVLEFKKELEVMAENMQQELIQNHDEEKASLLNKVKSRILDLTSYLFTLYISMNAGLDNQHYVNAYENVLNLYF